MKRFLTVFAVLLLGTTAWSQSPSCSFVQARSSSGYGNSDPAVITGTAGDTYWVFSSASYLTRPSTTAYVSDGVDTFSQIGSTYNPYGGVTAGAQWYAPNIAGGPVRITTSLTNSGQNVNTLVFELSPGCQFAGGAVGYEPTDQLSVSTGTFPTSGSVLVVAGATAYHGGTWTAGSGLSIPSNSQIVEYGSGSPYTVGEYGTSSAGTASISNSSEHSYEILMAATFTAGASVVTPPVVTSALSITTASLPGGTAGVTYTPTTLAATGGSGTYSSWVVTAGTLPAGLTLASTTGTVSGVPSAAGSATFTVQVTDSSSNKATAQFTVTINQPVVTTPPVVTPPATGAQPGTTAPTAVTHVFANGCQAGPINMYYNQPVDGLPLDQQNAAKIASLGAGNLGPSPEFTVNMATATTPHPAIMWQNTNGESDSGTYPIDPGFFVSEYTYPNDPTVLNHVWGGPNDDAHLLVVDERCINYEIYQMQNQTPPYVVSTGSIFDMNSTALRTDQKIITLAQDSDGLGSTDAAGMDISPLILTYAEAFSGKPINHGFRFALSQAQGSPYWQWPATHTGGRPTGTANILMGSTFRLNPAFDTGTCHYGSSSGQPFPSWFQTTLTALKAYGLYFADYTGNPGLVGVDADERWGDPSSSTSPIWQAAGFWHCIRLADLQIVDNQSRILDINDGAVKTGYVAY